VFEAAWADGEQLAGVDGGGLVAYAGDVWGA
jgi:hypothetical protein